MAVTRTIRSRRLDSIRLDVKDRTYFTEEGYLVDHPVLTSCGIFEYTRPDGTVRRELRLPEHVFAEASLKSYKGKPIIITHSAEKISKDNVGREQIGTILSDGYRDGDDVRAEIIIHDTDAMRSSGLKELSLGYSLDPIEEPGTWEGEPYDAVQTDITINHLALVASARAGDQARLNIDGSDIPELKGGKAAAIRISPGRGAGRDHPPSGQDTGCSDRKKDEGGNGPMEGSRTDSIDITPEELVEAISQYKASRGGAGPAAATDGGAGAKDTGGGTATTGGQEPPAADIPPADTPPAAPAGQEPPAVEKDGDAIPQLVAAVEQLLAALKAGSEGKVSADGAGCGQEGANTDGSGDMSKSLNADSADDLFRKRLSICRVGDKLGIEGLEELSILDGKKAVIAKVLPDMRLDGKDTAYVDAAYDIAVGAAGKRKDVSYQRQQMASGAPAPGTRNDGAGTGGSMASEARKKMIDREGGRE